MARSLHPHPAVPDAPMPFGTSRRRSAASGILVSLRPGQWTKNLLVFAPLIFAVKLFEVGKVSLGQAAKIAELSKRAFMEILGRYGVPVFSYSPEELRNEVDS